jgi:hypothetical protein
MDTVVNKTLFKINIIDDYGYVLHIDDPESVPDYFKTVVALLDAARADGDAYIPDVGKSVTHVYSYRSNTKIVRVYYLYGLDFSRPSTMGDTNA